MPVGSTGRNLGSGGAINCTMCAVWHGVAGHTTVCEPSGCRHSTLSSHQNAGKACYGPSGWRHCTPRMDDPAIEGLVGAWACSWVYGTLSCALSSCCWQQMCRICTEYWCKTVGWSTSVAKEEADMGTDSCSLFLWGGQLQLWHAPSCDANGGPCSSFLTWYLTGPILCG